MASGEGNMKVEWKALGWAWLVMLLTNAFFGFLLGFVVEEQEAQTVITAAGTFAAGGYVAYRLASERKGLHALVAIVGYYLILLAFIAVVSSVLWLAQI